MYFFSFNFPRVFTVFATAPTALSALEVLWSPCSLRRASRRCGFARSDVLTRSLGPGKSDPIREMCWMKTASSSRVTERTRALVLRKDCHVDKPPSLAVGHENLTSRLQQTIDPWVRPSERACV
ncbi:hypothetical protein EDB85DRAFT_1351985 [Lactarius pseudohatsudake]|nr:hypothetical protein EDB85DRAFT_1351985 [Lactarius pseudohatsudake]